jgi:hypothetical protein
MSLGILRGSPTSTTHILSLEEKKEPGQSLKVGDQKGTEYLLPEEKVRSYLIVGLGNFIVIQ